MELSFEIDVRDDGVWADVYLSDGESRWFVYDIDTQTRYSLDTGGQTSEEIAAHILSQDLREMLP